MATPNLYAAYKRDTKYLLFWMVETSNTIVRKRPASEDGALFVNLTGQVTTTDMVNMAQLIALNLPTIPTVVYRLLKSIIAARTEVHGFFQQVAAKNPDPEIESNNISHKHFIDKLEQVFDNLGGHEWEEGVGAAAGTGARDADLEELILSNKFSALGAVHSHDGEEAGSGEEESADEAHESSAPVRRKATRSGKGKRGKDKKKRAKQPARAAAQTAEEPKDAPLESYRIVEHFEKEGTDGWPLKTDYLLAVYDSLHAIAMSRAKVQSIWQEVAYAGLNSAVAATYSNVAIKSIKKLDSQMFVDFPGDDSYMAVWNALTCGNLDKLRNSFKINMYKPTMPSYGSLRKIAEATVDIEEQCLFYTYRNLSDFLVDFQLNHSGKPTKRMSAELKDWKPKADLERMTNVDRIQWRRSYTINWLYDLVNLFSSIVMQRINMKGEKHDLASVDWSATGPWSKHRRLYGLNDFAGFVTSLAMQKPGFDVASKILPHHVFQLQCIVDSWAVSRGWSIDGYRGHKLTAPASKFAPRRDLDLFLNRDATVDSVGFLQYQRAYKKMLKRMGIDRGSPELFTLEITMLEWTKDGFTNWLGESKYMHGFETIPPSRFSSSNTNGLWEYSPFLCGTGLIEGLEIAYQHGVQLMEVIPDVTMLLHLHNMLVRKGYLEREIGIWGALQMLFPDEFFGTAGPPSSEFAGAFLSQCKKHTNPRKSNVQRRRALRETHDIPKFLADVKKHEVFNRKPLSMLLREADWDPDAIPRAELPVYSLLRAQGILGPEELSSADHQAVVDDEIEKDDPKLCGEEQDWGATFIKNSGFKPNHHPGFEPNDLIKEDIRDEVGGEAPVLGFNYLYIMLQANLIFDKLMQDLASSGNGTYRYLCGQSSSSSSDTGADLRTLLTTAALGGTDEDCLRTMAKVIWEYRSGCEVSLYWKKLDLEEERLEQLELGDHQLPQCVAM